ncbi:hypothetical protein [Neobacillus vireti]|uniref:Uncharacterized protein n=1 Tax=Neobacillus vireti LMG 21834 TaxID=1131730 RepID=A0AB94IL40_9BACI|nr:hypothetical protein [Neobacillus vireti]ETI67762.1 hypothetical protein BAVI_15982 [Neobacillus vireti LMG 21834]KLT16110.1 hypothetical protein AA980_19280 [Neobacillus vireti]
MSNFINLRDFKKWILKKELERETIEGFWENFNSWKKECPEEYEEKFKEGFKPEKLSIYINTVSFTITNYPDEDFNHVVIKLNYEYDDSVIGEYRMVFDYGTGEIFDDIFSVY